MKYCKKCTMPDTRPGIMFDENGVCCACKHYENRINIDWDSRFKELETLCDKYRGCNGSGKYDCAIAVSGGKDSHFQVHIMKEVMHMNPVLFSVEDNFPMTEAGMSNIKNISEEFGCPIISYKPNIKAQKRLMRAMFEKYGKPTWYIDRYIYTFPLHMSLKFNTMLLVYGENISYEYGGAYSEESYSAKEQINNGVASGFSNEELLGMGVGLSELAMLEAPCKEDLDRLEPIYLSYFVEWNSVKNYYFAKSRGFKDLTHEWDRTNHAENFDQVDSRAYLVHPWMKYPKFGHAAATDYTSRFIRYGLMTREEAIKIVKEKDHDLDPKAVDDFCKFCGYSKTEFWKIIDSFYNRDIFEKDKMGRWNLKNAIYE
ncbi:MAG: N-acetyl sugar amidotransferase [Lachnospiraceae bacterium]|nr:N-acetyl sugar amidotransferase [Lachnospiraceae bacterium]